MKINILCCIIVAFTTSFGTIPKKQVWTAVCDSSYMITIEKDSVFFYGTYIARNKKKYYFISRGVDVSVTDTSISFNLVRPRFSEKMIFSEGQNAAKEKRAFEHDVPSSLYAKINASKNEMMAHWVNPIYFSRFDTCTFRLIAP